MRPETDTPQTDSAIKASNGQWSYTLRDLCRKFERERNDLRHMLTKTTMELGRALEEVSRLQDLTKQRNRNAQPLQ